MRRGVHSGDETGAYVLDLAGEWLAVRPFSDDSGQPMFRSAAAPVAAGDVRALGAALAWSGAHAHEVWSGWIVTVVRSLPR